MKAGLAKFIETISIGADRLDKEIKRCQEEEKDEIAIFFEKSRNLLDFIVDIYNANDVSEVCSMSDKLKDPRAKEEIGLVYDLQKDHPDRKRTEAQFSLLTSTQRAESLSTLMKQENAYVFGAVEHYYLTHPDEFAQLVISARGLDKNQQQDAKQSQSTSATNAVTYPTGGHTEKLLNARKEKEMQMVEGKKSCACQLI